MIDAIQRYQAAASIDVCYLQYLLALAIYKAGCIKHRMEGFWS